MIRAGFIGTGGISAVHLNYLKAQKNVTIAALSDIDETTLRKHQTEYGGETFTDFQEMLRKVKLDAVWICTPPTVRRKPLLVCADRGIPVFCEKPAELSARRAAQIETELTKRKARVQVGYVFRSTPMIAILKDLIKDDHIHCFESYYVCNISLALTMPAWFFDKRRSGGLLIDQATHNMDLLRYLFGELVSVRGTAANPVHPKKRHYTIDETVALSLYFAGGIVGAHVHSWVGDSWRNEVVLSGEKRLYRVNLMKGTLTVESTNELSLPVKSRLVGRRVAKGVWVFEQDMDKFYHYENEIFLKQVVSNRWTNNPSNYADAVKSLSLTLACDRAVTRR